MRKEEKEGERGVRKERGGQTGKEGGGEGEEEKANEL